MLFPFVIGIVLGFVTSIIIKRIKDYRLCILFVIIFLSLSTVSGLLIDKFVFQSFSLNYLLIGMSFSATIANLLPEDKLRDTFKLYFPILNLSLIIVIVNLGMPLDYRLIVGAGLFTLIYILSRAIGKIVFSFIGGKLMKSMHLRVWRI